MRISEAGPADVPAITRLARSALPTMTAIHTERSWHEFDRFGSGRRLWDNCTLTLRADDDPDDLVGFVWVDPAYRIDWGIAEPWWCVNAIAVRPSARGRGAGRTLVAAVTSRATAAGVQLLVGQSVPDAVPFWRALRFTVAEQGEAVHTHAAARLTNGERRTFTFSPGADDRYFLRYLTTEPGSVQSGLIPASWPH